MQCLLQLIFASLECDRKKRKTRREIFLERIDGPIPRCAPGCPHCAGLSQGRRQGATAASRCWRCCACTAYSRSAIRRPGDGGLALRGRERWALCRGDAGETPILDKRGEGVPKSGVA